MRTVKQLAIEKAFLQLYSDLIWQSFKTVRNYSILLALLYSFLWATISFGLATIYWRIFILVLDGKMKAEDLLIVFAFGTFLMEAIRMVLSVFEDVGTSMSSAQNFFELFDRTPAIDNSSTEGRILVDFRGEIEFDQVSFVYPSRPDSVIFNNFQLLIKPGQRVALVGKSGCGKSSLVQLLQRFYDVTHGYVLLDGVDIRELNIHWVRSRLGLVSQEPILFDLTIAENIAYGQDNILMEDIIEAAIKANIHQFIQQLPQGYDTRVGIKGTQLSGGEKQRVAIARAFLRQPKVLLLDEATSAMDTQTEQLVQNVLEQAQVTYPDRTSITIAHRLSTISSCDVIHVIDRGYLMESGTHMELMLKGGAYYRMFVQ